MGEHFRVFPISNWTEMDVWDYISQEKIPIPALYFAHQREAVFRDGAWLPNSELLVLRNGEKVELKQMRFRTLGDITITGGIESRADTLEKIVMEVSATRSTERGNRSDDKRSDNSMEDRKKTRIFLINDIVDVTPSKL